MPSMTAMDVLCTKLRSVYAIDKEMYRACVSHIFDNWSVKEILSTEFHSVPFIHGAFDREKNLIMNLISEDCGLIQCTPEYYEEFVAEHKEYKLNGLEFLYDRISLNDDCVTKLMKTCFADSHQPVPYEVLKYLMDNPHLYEKFKDYSYLPQNEKCLEIFCELNIRSTIETAAFCQEWCSIHDTYFEMFPCSYEHLLRYDRCKTHTIFVMCKTKEEIKTALSVMDRAPTLHIGVPTLELLEILEDSLLQIKEIRERICPEETNHSNLSSMPNDERKEIEERKALAYKRMDLSSIISYWSVSADDTYYHKLVEEDIHEIMYGTHCRNAIVYLSRKCESDRETAMEKELDLELETAIKKAKVEDLLYLHSLGFNIGKYEKYVHLLK